MPDHPIPLLQGSLSLYPSVPTATSVRLGSDPLCSPCVSPSIALVLADGRAAPLLLLRLPGWTGKIKLSFCTWIASLPSLSYSRHVWHVYCRERPVPDSAYPHPQGGARWPGLGLPPVPPGCPAPDQGVGWPLADRPCPATTGNPRCSQPSSCPDASPKQGTIGSQPLLHCSVTANSSASLLLWSYLLHNSFLYF